LKSKKILVPVFGSVSASEIARISFWLARNEPAELNIVEVIAPLTFFLWLISLLLAPFRKNQSRRLRQTQQNAIWKEKLVCKISEHRAPNNALGIVEAARRINPDIVIIAFELRRRLGKAGMGELKRRLSEIGDCVLLLPGRGPAMRVEVCRKKDVFAPNRLVSINRNK
jgi:universal stress protein family protein